MKDQTLFVKKDKVEAWFGKELRIVLERVDRINEPRSRGDGVGQYQSVYDKRDRRKSHLETTLEALELHSERVISRVVKSETDLCVKGVEGEKDIKGVECASDQFLTAEIILEPDPDKNEILQEQVSGRSAVARKVLKECNLSHVKDSKMAVHVSHRQKILSSLSERIKLEPFSSVDDAFADSFNVKKEIGCENPKMPVLNHHASSEDLIGASSLEDTQLVSNECPLQFEIIEGISACRQKKVDDFTHTEKVDGEDIEFSAVQFFTSEVLIKPDPDAKETLPLSVSEGSAVIKDENFIEEKVQFTSHCDEFGGRRSPHNIVASSEKILFDHVLGGASGSKNGIMHVEDTAEMFARKIRMVDNSTSIEEMERKGFEANADQFSSTSVSLDGDRVETSFGQSRGRCASRRMRTMCIGSKSQECQSAAFSSRSETTRSHLCSWIKSGCASTSIDYFEGSFEISRNEVSENALTDSPSRSVLKRASEIHLEEKSLKQIYSCAHCSAEFSSKGDLRKHIKTHIREQPFECTDCLRRFSDKSNLKKHIRTHTGEKPFGCTFCSRKFSDMSTYNYHIKIHTGEKPYECGHCGAKFISKENLRSHIRRHSGEKPFHCTYCNAKFSQRNSLNIHSRSHTGEKPFSCSHCKKKYSCQGYLKIHIRTHTGERPYSCSKCSMTFVSSNNLRKHDRTHTGERPYKCSHCSAKFAQTSNRDIHIRSHTGERPFGCSYSHCNAKFSSKLRLKFHIRIHTGERPFSCSHCKASFTHRNSFKRHLLRVHGSKKQGV